MFALSGCLGCAFRLYSRQESESLSMIIWWLFPDIFLLSGQQNRSGYVPLLLLVFDGKLAWLAIRTCSCGRTAQCAKAGDSDLCSFRWAIVILISQYNTPFPSNSLLFSISAVLSSIFSLVIFLTNCAFTFRDCFATSSSAF